MKSMVMDFKGYQIKNLKYGDTQFSSKEISEMSTDDNGNAMELNVKIGYSSNLLEGIVELGINIYNNVSKRSLNLEIVGEFDLSEDLSEEEVEDLLSQNGTAILFPYLRSIVSIVTTLDSKDAIILPTINAAVFKDLDIKN